MYFRVMFFFHSISIAHTHWVFGLFTLVAAPKLRSAEYVTHLENAVNENAPTKLNIVLWIELNMCYTFLMQLRVTSMYVCALV